LEKKISCVSWCEGVLFFVDKSVYGKTLR